MTKNELEKRLSLMSSPSFLDVFRDLTSRMCYEYNITMESTDEICLDTWKQLMKWYKADLALFDLGSPKQMDIEEEIQSIKNKIV